MFHRFRRCIEFEFGFFYGIYFDGNCLRFGRSCIYDPSFGCLNYTVIILLKGRVGRYSSTWFESKDRVGRYSLTLDSCLS